MEKEKLLVDIDGNGVIKISLTQKNKLFIQEYIKNNYTNATEAYMKVYDGSYDTAKVQASRILKKPEAIEYLKEVQKRAYEEAGITAERIALTLAEMAFDDGEKYSPTARTKALDLLQKQLGLQTQKVSANVSQEKVIEVSVIED